MRKMPPRPPKQSAAEIQLVPLSEFSKIAAKVFTTSKAESDRQLEAFQKTNPLSHAKPHKGKGKRGK